MEAWSDFGVAVAGAAPRVGPVVMRALGYGEHDDPNDPDPRVGEFADPEAGDGRLVAAVLAAALNPVDVATAGDARAARPRVVGGEAVVELSGRPGYVERTVAPYGAFAERTAVDPATVLALPDDADPVAVVAAARTGLAAWLPLTVTADLRRGETVLVLGADAVVGQVAVQVARILGAGRVVAAGHVRSALEPLEERGADAVVRLTDESDAATLAEALDGAADLVFDPVYGADLVRALEVTRVGGRTVTIGLSYGGAVAAIPASTFFGKTLLNYANITTSADVKERALRRIFGHVASGELVVDTVTFPLDRAAEGWRHYHQHPEHKVVVVPPRDHARQVR